MYQVYIYNRRVGFLSHDFQTLPQARRFLRCQQNKPDNISGCIWSVSDNQIVSSYGRIPMAS